MKTKAPINSIAGPNYAVLTKADYFTDLIGSIQRTRSGDRVSLSTMIFHPDKPYIRKLVRSLSSAAERGVRVTFTVDAFSFLIRYGMQPGPLYFHRKLPQRLSGVFAERQNALKKIIDAGGQVAVINKPSNIFKNPFAGRSHIKYAIVNDVVYAGGCNLDAANQLDFMVRYAHAPTADWLHNMTAKLCVDDTIIGCFGTDDITRQIDVSTDLILDVGVQNQSQIYDQAIGLIDSARESIIITCQFFPFGKTARHLAAARARGVQIKIIYNHPAKPEHGFLASMLHRYVLIKEKRLLPTEFFTDMLPKKHKFLHAKMLITDQGSIIGSHNFLFTGVQLGTAEVAVCSKDKNFSGLVHGALMGVSSKG